MVLLEINTPIYPNQTGLHLIILISHGIIRDLEIRLRKFGSFTLTTHGIIRDFKDD